MHRTLCMATALVLVATGSVAAQQQQGSTAEMKIPPASHWMIGPFAGMNYTTLVGSDLTGLSSRMDFAAGGQLDLDFGANGLFRTGLQYARRGAESKENGESATLRINYVEVPLLLGYRFPTEGGIRPFVMGGGHVAFQVGCTMSGTSGSVSVSADCEKDLDAKLASTDLALIGGGGLLFPVGTSSLRLDVHYAYGLTDVEKTSSGKNRGFTFGVGFLMPIGR